MKSSQRLHVVPRGNQWVCRFESSEPMAYFDTQQAAIDFAKSIAKSAQSELIIHGENGRIRDCRSYGNDPYPPRG